jgi:hypothetical protein
MDRALREWLFNLLIRSDSGKRSAANPLAQHLGEDSLVVG